MGKRMSNAPVYFALAQAHFNPVAAMSKYVDEIQDRLRREGYPLFNRHEITQLTIPSSNQTSESAQPQIRQQTSWLLDNNDRTAGFVLGSSAITYQTTHYETHKKFIAELLRGLGAVDEVVELDHVRRLGLRYLDAVIPRDGEKLEQYLVDGLHGLDFQAKRRFAMTESVFSTQVAPLVDTGTLVVRIYTRPNERLGFPPDLGPHRLVTNPKFDMKSSCSHAVIDTDHYAEGHMPMDFGHLEKQLLSLHRQVSDAFKAAATDHARTIWA